MSEEEGATNLLHDGYKEPSSDAAEIERRRHAVRLERLRDVLSQKYWNFSAGRLDFDGFSEGLCLLAGIYPEGGHASPVYAPRFLPGALASLDFKERLPRAEDQTELRESLSERMQHLRGLRLEGFVAPNQAIQTAIDFDVGPCWLKIACEDFECAKRLPPNAPLGEEMLKRLHRHHARSGGSRRALKDKKTQLIRGPGRKEFERLRAGGFQNCQTKAGKPNANAIAHLIYDVIAKDHEGDAAPYEGALPSLNAIADNVRKWLKEIGELKSR